MKNYAGVKGCDDAIEAELIEAGIPVQKIEFLRNRGEVPTSVLGQLGKWGFTRAWYYWVASGPGISVDVAEQLHEKHGKEVRVEGHCGCPSPREYNDGFAVGLYHVDSQAGLNALAGAIRKIMAENKAVVNRSSENE